MKVLFSLKNTTGAFVSSTNCFKMFSFFNKRPSFSSMPDFSEANCKIFVSGVESLSCLPLNFKVVDVDECDDEKCLPSAVGNVQLDVK